MTIVDGTDPTATHVTVTNVFVDNDGVQKTVTKSVRYAVVSSAVVPDPKQLKPDVLINAQVTK